MQEFIDSSGLDANLLLLGYAQESAPPSLMSLSSYQLPPYIYNNIATLFGEQRMETIALLLVVQLCNGCQLDRYNAGLLSRLLIINPAPAEYVYKAINEQLYASLLAEDN